MSDFNYLQAYANEKKRGVRVGRSATESFLYHKAKDGTVTKKQIAYHNSLHSFLLERGLAQRGDIFDNPKNCKDCQRKINAMNTILRKAGLSEEFYGKDSEK